MAACMGTAGNGAGKRKRSQVKKACNLLILLVDEAGFEPAAFGFGGQRSIQLSYPSLYVTRLSYHTIHPVSSEKLASRWSRRRALVGEISKVHIGSVR